MNQSVPDSYACVVHVERPGGVKALPGEPSAENLEEMKLVFFTWLNCMLDGDFEGAKAAAEQRDEIFRADWAERRQGGKGGAE